MVFHLVGEEGGERAGLVVASVDVKWCALGEQPQRETLEMSSTLLGSFGTITTTTNGTCWNNANDDNNNWNLLEQR